MEWAEGACVIGSLLAASDPRACCSLTADGLWPEYESHSPADCHAVQYFLDAITDLTPSQHGLYLGSGSNGGAKSLTSGQE